MAASMVKSLFRLGLAGLLVSSAMASSDSCVEAECDSPDHESLLQLRTDSDSGADWPGFGCPCKREVDYVQQQWKAAILSISQAYPQTYVEVAKAAIQKLYGYDLGPVLFKPTKASENQFRPTSEGALSYFVGFDAIKPQGFEEDKGFAINEGNGWEAVSFKNNGTSCYQKLSIAQGEYFFTNFDGNTAKVEYSFVYKKAPCGKLKIVLHHSSLPFKKQETPKLKHDADPAAFQAVPRAMSEQAALIEENAGKRWDCGNDVRRVQEEWKQAILDISDAYLQDPQGEKFKDIAKKAAGALYGYDIGHVLFKPTKAVQYPFRPTAEGALSYFIGWPNVQPASCCQEDQGFAINGGSGWSWVRFENDEINCYDDLAFAQGNYFFTDATSGNVSKVEYSFGYKRTRAGKLKIVLHHSSAPYSPDSA